MTDRTQWPPYGAYCSHCDRPISQKYPPTVAHRTHIRCANCGHVTPAYRNRSPEQVKDNRTHGSGNGHKYGANK